MVDGRMVCAWLLWAFFLLIRKPAGDEARTKVTICKDTFAHQYLHGLATAIIDIQTGRRSTAQHKESHSRNLKHNVIVCGPRVVDFMQL